MKLRFLGATGTVTGSRHLVVTGGRRLLVDCGLFQGFKQLRLRNRAPFPVRPDRLSAVVVTHAHLDHTGYLPALVKAGYRGPIYSTPATRDLCAVILPDSGALQEEEAHYANKKGFSKHHPALPLYTRADAEKALGAFVTTPAGSTVDVAEGVQATFHRAGHILGAATVTVAAEGREVVFTGDLGRPDDPILDPPDKVARADVLVCESTYGDREHGRGDPADDLADAVRRVSARGGTLVIPAFAVGRTQLVLYYLHRLREEDRIPELPVYLDSPMAVDATEIFERYGAEHRLSSKEVRAVCEMAKVVNDAEASKALDRDDAPKIIVSASGMATGGRVVHHIKKFAPDPKNMLLFTGYQAGGTRGRSIVSGAKHVRIHGGDVPIRAEVRQLNELSAHADAAEIIEWLRGFGQPPKRTYLVHGEPDAADALRRRIERELHWDVRIPEPLAAEAVP